MPKVRIRTVRRIGLRHTPREMVEVVIFPFYEVRSKKIDPSKKRRVLKSPT